MKNILLPEKVDLNNFPDFLKKLGSRNNYQQIVIDFRCVRFYSIPAIISLAGKIRSWVKQGKSIRYENDQGFPARRYFERMNFFNLTSHVDRNESFVRNNPHGRFVEIQKIENSYRFSADRISSEIAACIAPEQAEEIDPDKSGFHDGIEYFVSELILNVIQHSKGTGFIGAQYYNKWDETQIAIADIGIGLRNSFIENESPFARDIHNDRDAIDIALKNRVSSKTHRKDPLTGATENRGVGLTFLREMTQMAGGTFIIASGDTILENNEWYSLAPDLNYAGTIVCLSFKRNLIDNEGYGKLLESVKVKYVD